MMPIALRGAKILWYRCEEYLYGKGVSVIEWSERIEDILPPETWHIRIREEADGNRLFILEGPGLEELFK